MKRGVLGLDDFTVGDLEQMLNDAKVHNDKLSQEDDCLDKRKCPFVGKL